MKFLIKFLCVISAITLLSAHKVHSDCDNPCVACQRTAYQLKFQQIADCGNTHCKNTCYKVKELWNNSPDHVFKPFEKDVFGKCEICFRAGFCSIAECKAQQEMELEVIAQIVNKAHINAKKIPFLGKQEFDHFHSDPLFNDSGNIADFDKEVEHEKSMVNKALEASFANKNAKVAIKEVNKVIDNLFKKDAKLSGKTVEQVKSDASAKTEKIVEEKEKVTQFAEATAKYVKHVEKVIDAKKKVTKEGAESKDKDKVNGLVKKTITDIEKKINDNKKILKEAKKKHLTIVKAAIKGSLSELSRVKKLLNKEQKENKQ